MAFPGTVHTYSPRRLIAFEHAPPPSQSSSPSPSTSTSTSSSLNTLLWIGGLSDGLLTVEYPQKISTILPPTWRIAEVHLSSSYKGWGLSSLARDARELGQCVAYFKTLRPGGKVVLMGHSTGCQDVMQYVVGQKGAGEEDRIPIDGGILQGGVSDREAWDSMMAEETPERRALFERTKRTARDLVDAGRGKEVMGREGNIMYEEFNTPVTAYRIDSLLSAGGDDDYFSSDLSDDVLAKTFGRFPPSTPLMFLLGELDPYVPASVSREGLITRWTDAVRKGGGVVDDGNGGVVEGAHHNLNDDPEDAVRDLAERVVRFLRGVESGEVGKGEGARL
ncbi:hypothetical protein B0J11DRAFT_521911 [Dendryphion nanum]|uniref:DUF1749-domain-containing protein n=1 Tax=Dendryphion nanum TaxID=256645 RepID=A0A9P9IU67_9PLEO|nr:hypothetical protein B0J11DRAFT_521911 [Dendryphion nanum]